MTDDEPDDEMETDLGSTSALAPETAKKSGGKSTLEADRRAAKKALRNIVTGRQEAGAGQMAGIKMLLQGELEPERDPNPYAGLADVELIERLLTCAASVLGVKALSQMLVSLSARGEADVLNGVTTFDYQPPQTDSPPEEGSKSTTTTAAEQEGLLDLPSSE